MDGDSSTDVGSSREAWEVGTSHDSSQEEVQAWAQHQATDHALSQSARLVPLTLGEQAECCISVFIVYDVAALRRENLFFALDAALCFLTEEVSKAEQASARDHLGTERVLLKTRLIGIRC